MKSFLLTIILFSSNFVFADILELSRQYEDQYLSLCRDYVKVVNSTTYQNADTKLLQDCQQKVAKAAVEDVYAAKTKEIISQSSTLTFTASNYIKEPKPIYKLPVSSLDLDHIRCNHETDSSKKFFAYCVVQVAPELKCSLKLDNFDINFDENVKIKNYEVGPPPGCITF